MDDGEQGGENVGIIAFSGRQNNCHFGERQHNAFSGRDKIIGIFFAFSGRTNILGESVSNSEEGKVSDLMTVCMNYGGGVKTRVILNLFGHRKFYVLLKRSNKVKVKFD